MFFNRKSIDKKVVRLLQDRTVGNTMAKVWRQLEEAHCMRYLQRKDLYVTILKSVIKEGKIGAYLQHSFPKPPEREKLPSPKTLRMAYLLSEMENVDDYRSQIMSIYGKVLKFDSTKKV
mgnify:CR=1 FL=1